MTRPSVERRRVLRGMLGGAAITVGLPLFDDMFDDHGRVLAATGQAPPACFGTWFWGCGLTPGQWEPATIGPGYAMAPQMEALSPFRDKINIFSGMNVYLDGRPNFTHSTGAAGVLTGTAPILGNGLGYLGGEIPTIDSLVADHIGTRTRFRSLEFACTRVATDSFSTRGGNVLNPTEVSPLSMYTRIFGAGFTDPNAATFTPDPEVMTRLSALSAVTEQREALIKTLGAADRIRADEYFTSLRQLENKLSLELQRPEPLPSCSVLANPGDGDADVDFFTILDTQKLFGQILAHAMACGQTRVFHSLFTQSQPALRRPGRSEGHHQRTHEEPNDLALGFQADVDWGNRQHMKGFAVLLEILDGIKEGAGTLLDRTLVFACSDVGYAKNHNINNMTIMTAGSASGRIKTGYHLAAAGDTVSRVGLTAQQVMGLPISTWGTESNETSKVFTEILV
ncbi:MAG: DUF1552 domain-containing protein [Alphaproteobacteria bacterium]|nr:DUF1552 domain-containing protein [Alphaproteobacteria bacterium]